MEAMTSRRDVMPLPIVELVGQVKNVFDVLVIATPYHDMASRQWENAIRWTRERPRVFGPGVIMPYKGLSGWIRNIDPFLFGFLKQVPELMFFLGRWSGTGIFPLIGEMIADTIAHIRKGKDMLVNVIR